MASFIAVSARRITLLKVSLWWPQTEIFSQKYTLWGYNSVIFAALKMHLSYEYYMQKCFSLLTMLASLYTQVQKRQVLLYEPWRLSQGLPFQNWNGRKKGEAIRNLQAILSSGCPSAIIMLFRKGRGRFIFLSLIWLICFQEHDMK